VVQLDCLADDAGLAAVLLLPEEITGNGYGARVAIVSGGGVELAADESRHSHVCKQVGGVAADVDRDGEVVACERRSVLIHQKNIVDRG
jgi:hypothetical protein